MREQFPIWLLLRIDQDGVMATKLAIKNPAPQKAVPAKKAAPAKKAVPDRVVSSRFSRVPNAESLEALAELQAGKLTRYADTASMFKKLGIKVAKA